MDDLADLPFERVLNYLGLSDRIKCRAVSRRWREKIDSMQVTSLFYSEKTSDFIFGKDRLVVGAFAHNYIASTKWESFFDHFRSSILSHLRDLRVCEPLDLQGPSPAFEAILSPLRDLRVCEPLDLQERSSAFEAILNSLEHLQTLDLLGVTGLHKKMDLRLPKLQSIRLDNLGGIEKLTLRAPNLSKIKISLDNNFTLHLVHPESVRSVFANNFFHLELDRMKNLEYIFCEFLAEISDNFLANLQQLKEIHLNAQFEALEVLHDQKRRLGRNGLKIYYVGLCLDSAPNANPLLYGFDDDYTHLNEKTLSFLMENYPRLAEQLPLFQTIKYDGEMQNLVPDEFWKRITNLKVISLRFPKDLDEDTYVLNLLEFLQKFETIPELLFNFTNQRLFDQLPAYCPVLSVQRLSIRIFNWDLDFNFLFSFKNLVHLNLASTNIELFPRLFEELLFLRTFLFQYKPKTMPGNGFEMRIKVEEPKKKIHLAAEWRVPAVDTDLDSIAEEIDFRYWLFPMEGEEEDWF